MEFFGGEALFSQTSSGVKPYSFGGKPIFRGECNFSWSSGVRRKGKSSTGGLGGGVVWMLLTIIIIPQARMGSESIAHEAEGRMDYWLRGHEGERNNIIVLVKSN